MNNIYLDLGMGAAGDMLSAALFELLSDEDKKRFTDKINSCGLEGVTVEPVCSVKCGITGTKMKVLVDGIYEGFHDHDHHDHDHHEHDHHHHHSGPHDIEHIIDHLDISDTVKHDAQNVFGLIARAESHVHGVSVDEIHFHEVGTKDAVADVVSFCLLKEMLKADRITASYVVTGYGRVKCAHGILPVPAPATAYILQGIPVKRGNIEMELCTPTGAAILKYFVDFNDTDMVFTPEAVGYGMGERDLDEANCVRAFLYGNGSCDETAVRLSCNIDDMTAEQIGYAMEKFLEEGALDVWSESIVMKRSRPATMINVLCTASDTEKFVSLIFMHTSTLGIRKSIHQRYILSRKTTEVQTSLGTVHVKCSEGYGVSRRKYEYSDVAKIASESGISFDEALRVIKGRDNE